MVTADLHIQAREERCSLAFITCVSQREVLLSSCPFLFKTRPGEGFLQAERAIELSGVGGNAWRGHKWERRETCQ